MKYEKVALDQYGLKIIDVVVGDAQESLTLRLEDGNKILFWHYQDCCEEVYIEDIDIDITDLIGTTLVSIEVASNESCENHGHQTWTFYKIQTDKTCATVRWFGESNGYYSESVDIDVI